MKVRFFGSPDCQECMEVFVLLNKFDVDYDYINALDDDEEIQRFCDRHEVDELPHLQFILNGHIISRHIGKLKEEDIIGYLADYFSTD